MAVEVGKRNDVSNDALGEVKFRSGLAKFRVVDELMSKVRDGDER